MDVGPIISKLLQTQASEIGMTRLVTSVYIITLFGDPIAWRSHKQNQITTSTCQAEYLAVSEACAKLISLDKAISKTFFPVTICCNNMAASKPQKWKLATNWKLLTTLWKLYEKIYDLESKQSEEKLSQSHGDYIKRLSREPVAYKTNVNFVYFESGGRTPNSLYIRIRNAYATGSLDNLLY